jgi:hypothetical protein
MEWNGTQKHKTKANQISSVNSSGHLFGHPTLKGLNKQKL